MKADNIIMMMIGMTITRNINANPVLINWGVSTYLVGVRVCQRKNTVKVGTPAMAE